MTNSYNYELWNHMDNGVKIEISQHARASGIIWVNDKDDTFDIPLNTAAATGSELSLQN